MTWEKGLRPKSAEFIKIIFRLVETFDLGKGIKTLLLCNLFKHIFCVETFDLGKGIKTAVGQALFLPSVCVETFDLGKGIKTNVDLQLVPAHDIVVETFDLGKGIKTAQWWELWRHRPIS